MLRTLKIFFGYLPLLVLLFGIQSGCRKMDNYDTSPTANLVFSTNIVKFDTVFTSVGSATHNFTAHNPGKKAVNISHIMLQGGAASYFRINIDGRATTDFANHELAAGDSIYIFAEVTIDPNQANMPFIVSDTILFILNGHTQKVALQAFGRNAHFINHRVLGCDTTWTNDGKPIVLYDTALVRKGCSLTIEKGVTVYCHPNSVLLVDGSITCNGTKAEPVLFRQDRLEHSYDNEPGQWFGIRILNASDTNSMVHTILQDGTVGIEVDSAAMPGHIKLTLSKCIIKNMSSSGVVSFGSTINATNCLIYSSGLYNIYCDLGGTYNFINCTSDISDDLVANRQPSIVLGNQPYKNADSVIVLATPLSAGFRNCILWGNLDDEVKFVKSNTSAFSTVFSNNVLKASKMHFDATNIPNKYPNFVHQFGGDYHLDTLSPAIDHAVTYPPIPVIDDLDDVIRKTPSDTFPDIGCYEYAH